MGLEPTTIPTDEATWMIGETLQEKTEIQLQDNFTWINENFNRPSIVRFRKPHNGMNFQRVKSQQTITLDLHFQRVEGICAAI